MIRKFAVPLFLGCALCVPITAGAQGGAGASTSSGSSRAFNPAISLNGLFLVSGYPGLPSPEPPIDGAPDILLPELPPEGMDVQEVELRFTADIDPYSRADATLAFHGDEIHFEEIYVISRILGGGFGLRGGKFYVDATSENILHTHQLPFVRRSLIDEMTFIEPYSDAGIELSYLLPLTPYVELKGVVVDGRDPQLFDTPEGDVELDGGDLAYNAALHTLVDLSESSTLAADGRWLGGRNDLGTNTLSQVTSAALTYRWTPTRTNRYKSLRLHAEYIYSDRASQMEQGGNYNGGWYGFAQYQFSRRWWAGARYGILQRSYDESQAAFIDEQTHRSTVQLAFVPSEFQALRLEYSYVESPVDTWSEIFLQFNFTIGSHPAHRY